MHPDEFLIRMRENTLPPRACIITFDDGFACTLHNAYPILKNYDMPFMVLISTGYVSNSKPWDYHIFQTLFHSTEFRDRKIVRFDGFRIEIDYSNSSKIRKTKARLLGLFQDQVCSSNRERFLELLRETLNVDDSPAYPRMLTEDEVWSLSANGVVIGAHTEWHVSVLSDGQNEFYRQAIRSKKALERIIGKSVDYFAYPYGQRRHCESGIELVRKCGFQYAFTDYNEPARSSQMPYLISRMGASWGIVPLIMGLLECKPSQLKKRLLRKVN